MLTKFLLLEGKMGSRKRGIKLARKDFSCAKAMEKYTKIYGTNVSLFSNKRKNDLDKTLIFHCEKRFNYWEDNKNCKIFRRGTIIYYCSSWDHYFAFDVRTEKIIGRAVLERDWLQEINVNEDYRRQGIGTNLIKAIVETIGQEFNIPARGMPGQTSYFLTEEGASLINSCRRKKIITDEQCMVDVPRTPSCSQNCL